jgi:hypothetical protein
MSDDETPKVTITADSLFGGGAKTEQVTVDSNRLNPVSEAERLWLERLAMPARPVDQFLQASCWLSLPALLVSVGRVIPTIELFLMPIAIALFIPLAASAYAWLRFPRLRWFLAYRFVLVVLGIVIGGL